MGGLRVRSEKRCASCRAPGDRHCARCDRRSCAEHQPHARLCAGCYDEYAQRLQETDAVPSGRLVPGRAIPLALMAVLLCFAATKLVVRYYGRPSPSDFLFVWIPLCFATGLLVMWIRDLLEDVRDAQRCARFIEERPAHRRRTRRPRPSTQL